MHGIILHRHRLFHPNFAGVPVGPDRPCWCQPEQTCRQRPTRSVHCGRETAQCLSKIRYMLKCTAALRGPPCDSVALVFLSILRDF